MSKENRFSNTPEYSNMQLAVTGHRPPGLAVPVPYAEETWELLLDHVREELPKQEPSRVFTGMAMGFDQAVAYVCAEKNIPFIACIPCDNYDKRWRDDTKALYHDLLERAEAVITVSPGPYEKHKPRVRNEYMVDRADRVMALFSGRPSGTSSCIRYAKKNDVPVVNTWDVWYERVTVLWENSEIGKWRLEHTRSKDRT